jgi:Cytochrome P450
MQTPVCIKLNRILHDLSVFPDPEVFNPQRWLVEVEERHRLEKFFVPFLRGTRPCLGMKYVSVTSALLGRAFPQAVTDERPTGLGYAELYLVIAQVFYNFDMELVDDTDRARDVDVVRDCFVGLPTPESKGIRTRLTERKV